MWPLIDRIVGRVPDDPRAFLVSGAPNHRTPRAPNLFGTAWTSARGRAAAQLREARQLDEAEDLRRWRYYDLRHFAVSQMLAAGAPLKAVQQIAGHKTATMTLDQYGHFIPSSAAPAVAITARLVMASDPEAA